MESVVPPFWRYRIRFRKQGAIRFISHRDMLGVLARAFRRACLPLRMSQGFNPHPRFSVLSPLPVGIEGLDEVLELDLAEPLPPGALTEVLAPALPPGLIIVREEQVSPSRRARVTSVRYCIRGDFARDAADKCMAQAELRVIRQDGKEINIRPYLKNMTQGADSCEVEVLVTSAGTARPAEIATALFSGHTGCPPRVFIERTAVNIQED